MTNPSPGPSTSLESVAPAFVEMAHRIVWCTVATTDTASRPRTRVLHPIWEWDGERLTGWIATGPGRLMDRHLDRLPHVSLTYWNPEQDTCSAECNTRWLTSRSDRHSSWERFRTAREPVGYDPAIVDGWDDPDSPRFGVLELRPTRLRVMPGSLMLTGVGDLLNWAA